MCGRYTIIKSPEELENQFEIDVNKEVYQTSFNIAPTQKAPIITNSNPHKASFFNWGLVPNWSKDPKVGYKMINARQETILEKPSFKSAFEKRRCVVLTDGFYEWKKNGKTKIPSFISLKSNKTFALAGLWDKWESPNNETLNTFTIITTSANLFMQTIHHRMPCIFENNQQIKFWLNNDLKPIDHLSVLKPLEKDKMKMHEVSLLVNSVKNTKASLIDPVENFGTLF